METTGVKEKFCSLPKSEVVLEDQKKKKGRKPLVFRKHQHLQHSKETVKWHQEDRTLQCPIGSAGEHRHLSAQPSSWWVCLPVVRQTAECLWDTDPQGPENSAAPEGCHSNSAASSDSHTSVTSKRRDCCWMRKEV